MMTLSVIMKSPWITMVITVAWVIGLCMITTVSCDQESVIMWTQKSSIWSHVRGIKGNIHVWLGISSNGVYDYVRGESQEHTNLNGISYDHVTKTVCWSDVIKHGIYCQPFNYTASRSLSNIKTVVQDRTLDIQDISIDWHTGNIYFAAGKSIAVAPSGKNELNIYKHLISTGFVDVSGITMDSNMDMLFWTDRGTGEVSSSTLSGKNRRTLYETGGNPLGITVFPSQRRVYWVDNQFGNLESSTYEGTGVTRHVQDDHDKDFTGLALHGGYAFVTSKRDLKLHIFFANTTSSTFSYFNYKELDATPSYITAMSVFPDKPTHECDTLGCQHICLNLGDGHGVCTCKTGYFLDQDHRTCSERQPRYIYTTGKQVLIATATIDYSDTAKVILDESEIVGNHDNVRALGYHYGKDKLFFSDVQTDVIIRCNPDGSVFEEHTVNTRNVEGIAIDWMTSNVYWADRDLGHIMVSQLSGRHHRILVSNAGQPTGIAVDAKHRRLFWNDASEGREGIITSQLDGSWSVGIVDYSSGIMHPQGLFLDPHNERLYWVDRDLGEIECIDYMGRNREKILISPSGMMYYDVTFYQDLTTWTDVNGGLRFRNSLTDEELPVGGDTSQRTYTQTYDVIAYDPYLQPQGKNPCGKKNGGCDQLCFGTPEGRSTCGCAIGFNLNEDGKSCDTVTRKEYFVLYTDPYHKQIYQSNLSIDNTQAHGLSLPLMDYPISMDFDAGHGRVVWIDPLRNEIKRSKLDGSDEKILRTIPVGSRPLRLSVDPRHGFVYYTDWERGSVSRMTLSGSDHEDLFTGIQQPFAVAIDYINETLAWTSKGKVELSDANGENRQVIADDLQEPSGVAFLPGEPILYFSDNKTGSIYSYNITSGVRSLLYQYEDYKIYSLAASPVHLYFTTYNEKAVYRIDRLTGERPATVGEPVFARVTDIKVVQGSVTPVYAGGGGFNWVILAGALAGLLLLALVLLAAILGTRRMRRKNAAAGTDAEGQGVGNDVDREYAYLNQSTLFDIRGSHDAMNGNANGSVGSKLNGNGKAMNGHDHTAEVEYANARHENIYTEPGEPVAANGSTHANGIHNGIHEANGHNGINEPNGAANGTNGIPAGGVAVIGASTDAVGPAVLMAVAKKPKYKQNKKTFTRNKKKTLPKDPEFEFTPENKVATRIQRLANRLRNRLSSVRWSQSDKEDEGPNPDPAPTLEAIGPERTGPAPNGRRVDIPPQLHQMPRGMSPASHCKPSHVRKSLNVSKAKGMIERTNSGETPTP